MLLGNIFFVLLILSVSACVTPIQEMPLDQKDLPTITGKDLAIVKREMPDFRAMTRGNMTTSPLIPVLGPLIADVLNKDTGRLIVLTANLSDPGYQIAETLARSLETKHGLKYVGVGTRVIDEDESIDAVSVAYRDFPLVLDLKTINWGLVYPLVFNDKYKFFYYGRLQIIATEQARVIVEGACLSLPKVPDSIFPYEKLLENGAAQLKMEIQKAVQFCVKDLSEKYLGM